MANAVSATCQKAKHPLKYLTKSLVRTALKCPRKLVYATKPDVYPRNLEHLEDPLKKHLAQEGERFGEYCKRLFPHGIEIGLDGSAVSGSPSLEQLVNQTHHMLTNDTNNERVTIFEGAICNGSFYIRPDILDRIICKESNRTELRLIEVKSKSWDSRHTVESKIWTAQKKKKKTIRSSFLPYIQDIAFQKMVCSLAYPDVDITSWLMLPDRAKKMKCISDNNELDLCNVPTVDETDSDIQQSVASLLNVDELVETALDSQVSYPGSKNGETLKDVVYQWSEQLNNDSFGLDSPSPIGTQCSSCEFRLKPSSESEFHSGFDICWENATGIKTENLQKNAPVVELFGNTKKSMTTFLSDGKYSFSDLAASDFDLLADSTPTKNREKKPGMLESISKAQRQWYQVQTHCRRRQDHGSNAHPKYILRRKGLEQEMRKWKYPLHFIDFETSASLIPYYPGYSPYDISAFQFSHHIMTQNNDGTMEVQHNTQFLHTEPGVCPNEAFLKSLHKAIGNDDGTIFQWSPHETNVLKSSLTSLDDSTSLTAQEIEALWNRRESMVDLCKLASKYYYVDGSEGSSSIKRLLKPTLAASAHLKSFYDSQNYNGMNYDNFQWYQLDENGCVKDPYDILAGENGGASNIITGGGAAAAFHELQINNDLDDEARKAIERSLLRYCELDTLAMVMIVQAWQEFLNNKQ